MDGQQMQYVQITVQTWQAILGIAAIVFAIGAAWASLRKTVEHLGDNLKTLTSRFDAWLHDLAVRNAAAEGRTASPYVPSEKGSVLLMNSGVRAVINEPGFKDWFFPLVDRHAPKTGYEVEQKIFSALIQTKDDPRWDAVKEFIFNHPVYDERTLTMERLLVVASWILRDEYIASRKIKL